jgi:hypothetical protein
MSFALGLPPKHEVLDGLAAQLTRLLADSGSFLSMVLAHLVFAASSLRAAIAFGSCFSLIFGFHDVPSARYTLALLSSHSMHDLRDRLARLS